MGERDIHFYRIDPSVSAECVYEVRRYRAYVGAPSELVKIGTVALTKRESWRTTPTGVRYSFRGYSRTWRATLPNGHVIEQFARSRRDAARALVEAMGDGN